MTVFDTIKNFIKKFNKTESKGNNNSKEAAKERLHLVLMQDRANVSADFLELMKQEIIEVIKKYIDVDESAIDVRLTNRENDDGTNGAPALYANIPIINIKNDTKEIVSKDSKKQEDVKTETEKKESNPKEENKENKNDIEKKEDNKKEQENKTLKESDDKKEISEKAKEEKNSDQS